MERIKYCNDPETREIRLNPKSFRPITLANHTFKILEKLILWHITESNLKIDGPPGLTRACIFPGKPWDGNNVRKLTCARM